MFVFRKDLLRGKLVVDVEGLTLPEMWEREHLKEAGNLEEDGK